MSLTAELQQLISTHTWKVKQNKAVPAFAYARMEAMAIADSRRPRKLDTQHIASFSHEKMEWFEVIDTEESALLLNKEYLGILDQWEKDYARFDKFTQLALSHFTIDEMEDGELAKLWKRFTELYRKAASAAQIIEVSNNIAEKKITGELAKIVHKEKRAECFHTLTAPVHLSYWELAEVDLLAIASGESLESLAEYRDRYRWKRNTLAVAQDLSIDHFENILKTWKESANDLTVDLSRRKNKSQRHRDEKEKFFLQHGASEEFQYLVHVHELTAQWQDRLLRLDKYFVHVAGAIIHEIARRRDISATLLLYAVSPEMTAYAQGVEPDANILWERQQGSIYIVTGDSVTIVTGKKERKELLKLVREQQRSELPIQNDLSVKKVDKVDVDHEKVEQSA